MRKFFSNLENDTRRDSLSDEIISDGTEGSCAQHSGAALIVISFIRNLVEMAIRTN